MTLALDNPILPLLAFLLVLAVIWRIERRLGSTHRYVSTACQHGNCRMCRKRCKYCLARCRCACHEAGKELP